MGLQRLKSSPHGRAPTLYPYFLPPTAVKVPAFFYDGDLEGDKAEEPMAEEMAMGLWAEEVTKQKIYYI